MAALRVRYFAWLRLRTGKAEEQVEAPDTVTTVRQLAAWLGQRHPGFAEALAAPGIVRFAVNQAYVPDDAPVRAGDEVAFFPPVTGG
ncbi:MAG: molybdopterin converting factor subunit 1 [Geminicoccaceae bacterium]